MAKTIKSTGPVPCRYMLIAERPGIVEARVGKVLQGPSGQETDRYLLTETGIARENVYCTNVVKDYRDGDNPTQEEIERDLPSLREEIVRVRPSFVLLMGLHSARAVLGPDIDIEWANGLMFPIDAFRFGLIGQIRFMSVYHAAHGLHQANMAGRIAFGFRQFGKMIRGEPLPTGHLSNGHQHNYHTNAIPLESIVAMDTEGTVDRPWGLSYSCRQGVATVQLNRGPKHRKWNCKTMDGALIVLHGAMHDLPVLAKMGVRPKRWTCTLLAAALLGIEPHGLKPLARRHLGLRMSDYDDIVRSARREKALQYLGQVLDIAESLSPNQKEK